VCHSVGNNNITGEAGNHLATVVLEHAAMTAFCGIPLASLRENSITELNLRDKGIGATGAIVLSKLLPFAVALTSLKCACRPKVFAFLSVGADTHSICLSHWQCRRAQASDRRAQGYEADRGDLPLEQAARRRLRHHHRELHPGKRRAQGAGVLRRPSVRLSVSAR
jgi:hypothetical protein